MSAVPVLGFAAWSGTGKTTLLLRLIPLLKVRGFRIGLIKKSHHDFEIDHKGKDSYELRMAGASPVMLSSSHRRAVITEHTEIRERTLAEELTHFDTAAVDLVLVEGFKLERFPKIELYRPALGKPLLFPQDDSVIAVASDTDLSLPPALPRLDLNRPEAIAEFILDRFLAHDGSLH